MGVHEFDDDHCSEQEEQDARHFADAWEKRMAEGVAAFMRYKAQELAAQQREVSNG